MDNQYVNTNTNGADFSNASYLDPTFSGTDIILSINGDIISSVQSISWSTTAEKAPVYTMGHTSHTGVASGKRGTSGTLVLVQFSRDELLARYNKSRKVTKFAMNDAAYAESITGIKGGGASLAEFDREMTNLHSGSKSDPNDSSANMVVESPVEYEDELPEFDITITYADGRGNVSQTSIYGITITASSTGSGVDTVVSEKAYVFIAQRVSPMREIKRNGVKVQSVLEG